MRTIIPLLVCLATIPAWAGTPTFGTTANCQSTVTTSGCSNTFTVSTTAGNIYWVVLSSNSAAALSGVSASDNASGGSNTYTLAYSDTTSAGNSFWVWYTFNPAKSATSVSCNFTSQAATYNCSVFSYTGLGTSGVGATITNFPASSAGSGTGTHTICASGVSGCKANYLADDTNDVLLFISGSVVITDTWATTVGTLRVNVTESGRGDRLTMAESAAGTAGSNMAITDTTSGIGAVSYLGVLVEMRSTNLSVPTMPPAVY